ncbi:MAG TPA: A/G-specific adenine glycosylase [Verrucomicrobiales bacterium]|jgi:A/G-specific adenine glycosylase|nr:A/G-specific adenine glycosylase [Verrucomicrobiales bacterium]
MTGETRASDVPLSPADRADFTASIILWFQREGRDYPWRRTRDPYAILVSEVMLQQTQIATVLGRGYYTRWMERFPDVQTLAAASGEDILQAWEGLGYYSRARNLQRAAQEVVKHHRGIFPKDREAIAALPGVGLYTLGAVLSFAFNTAAPIVDGNVARVLARVFSLQEEIDSPAGQRLLWNWAARLTDCHAARLYNSGIMELGQRICTPRQPACDTCPVQRHCRSAGPGAEALPRKKAARATVLVEEHVLWAQREGRLLLYQETGRRRQGLWRLPERRADEVSHLPLLSRTQYTITHHRVTLHVYDAPDASAHGTEQWQPAETLHALPMPGPFRKVVDALLPPSELGLHLR